MAEKPDMIIRAAQVPDAEAIAHVRVSAWRGAYRGLMPDAYLDRAGLEATEAQHLRDRLRGIEEGAQVSVAELAGRIVGYCAYGRDAGDQPEPAKGCVYALYVHPDAWRKGVGQRLLVYVTEYFKAQGLGQATLFVIEGNTRARQFYEQVGWKADGHRELYAVADFALPVLRYRMRCGQ
jgi:GNAT superfamily N-acetyltransferase